MAPQPSFSIASPGGGRTRRGWAPALAACCVLGGLGLAAVGPPGPTALRLGVDVAPPSTSSATSAGFGFLRPAGRPVASASTTDEARSSTAPHHSSGDPKAQPATPSKAPSAGLPLPLWLLAPIALAVPLLQRLWRRVSADEQRSADPLLAAPAPRSIAMAAWGSNRMNRVTLLGDVASEPQTFQFFDNVGSPRLGVAFYLNTYDRSPQGTMTHTHRIIVTHPPLVPIVQQNIRSGVGTLVEGCLQYDPITAGGAPKIVLDNFQSTITGGGPTLEGSPLSISRATLEGVVGKVEFRPYRSRDGQELRLASVSISTAPPLEEGVWHRLTFFNNRVVGYLSQSVATGDTIRVQTSMRYRSYTDLKGAERYSAELVVQSLLQHIPKGSQRGGMASTNPSATGVGGSFAGPAAGPMEPMQTPPYTGQYASPAAPGYGAPPTSAAPWGTPMPQPQSQAAAFPSGPPPAAYAPPPSLAFPAAAPAYAPAPASPEPVHSNGAVKYSAGPTEQMPLRVNNLGSTFQSPVFGPEVDVRGLPPYNPGYGDVPPGGASFGSPSGSG